MTNKRKINDFLLKLITICSSLVVLCFLFGILFYIFSKGVKSLNVDLLKNNYVSKEYVICANSSDEIFDNPNIKDSYFSTKYGIALSDSKTPEGNNCIKVSYVALNSPLKVCKETTTDTFFSLEKDYMVGVLKGIDENGNTLFGFSSQGAQKLVLVLDKCESITSLNISSSGGGIKGSLISTLILICFTLLFALPLGIGASIYLTFFCNNKRFKNIIVSLIDMANGVPSIIYGFCGALIFIPFVSTFSGLKQYSILAGALTMGTLLLPIIIKTTCEALGGAPNSYFSGSLALGASKTQTVFKVMLPCAIPGILTAVLLSIGRIIGESAALIFVMGTSINDDIKIFQGATTLSTHIWKITQTENPNYETACSISIIILVVVFMLSFLVKILSNKYIKRGFSNGKK